MITRLLINFLFTIQLCFASYVEFKPTGFEQLENIRLAEKSTSGSLMFFATADGDILLYDEDSIAKLPISFSSNIQDISYSKELNQLAVLDHSKNITYFDLNELKILKIKKVKNDYRKIALNSQGILGFSRDGSIYDVSRSNQDETSEKLISKGYPRPVSFKVVNEKNTKIMIGYRDGSIALFDGIEKRFIKKIEHSNSPIIEIKVNIEAGQISTLDRNGSFKLYTLNLTPLNTKPDFERRILTHYPTSHSFIFGFEDSLNFYNYTNSQIQQITFDNPVKNIFLTGDETSLFIQGRNGTIRVMKRQKTNLTEVREQVFFAAKTLDIDYLLSIVNNGVDLNVRNKAYQTAGHFIWSQPNHSPQETEKKILFTKTLFNYGLNFRLFDNKAKQLIDLIPESTLKDDILRGLEELDEDLLDAVYEQNIPATKKALQRGANVNIVDLFDMTPLMIAIDYDNIKLAEILFQQSLLHIDFDGQSGRDHFSYIKSQEMEDLFIYYENKKKSENAQLSKLSGEQQNFYKFQAYVEKNNIDLHSWTLGLSDSSTTTSFLSFIMSQNPESVRYLLNKGVPLVFKGIPLITATRDLDTYDIFIEYGESPETDKKNCSNLIFRMIYRNAYTIEKVKSVVEKYSYDPLKSIGCGGLPVSHLAIEKQDDRLFRYFYQKLKIDPNLADTKSGKTPLQTALQKGNQKYINALLKLGAKKDLLDKKGRGLIWYLEDLNNENLWELVSETYIPNQLDIDGKSLLTDAVENKDLPRVKALIQRGENPRGPRNIEYTKKPLVLAIFYKWQEGLEYILDHGLSLNEYADTYTYAQYSLAWDGSFEFIRNYDIDITKKGKNGESFAQVACMVGKVKYIKEFMWTGQQVKNPSWCKGDTVDLIKKHKESIRGMINADTEQEFRLYIKDYLHDPQLEIEYFSYRSLFLNFTQLIAHKTYFKLYEEIYGKVDLIRFAAASIYYNEGGLAVDFLLENPELISNNIDSLLGFFDSVYEGSYSPLPVRNALAKVFLNSPFDKKEIPLSVFRYFLINSEECEECSLVLLKFIKSGQNLDIVYKGFNQIDALITLRPKFNTEIFKEILLNPKSYQEEFYRKIKAKSEHLYFAAEILTYQNKLAPLKQFLEISSFKINERIDKTGNTMLIKAASNGNESIVRYLLDKGADKNLKNWNGDNARRAARAAGYRSLGRLIRRY